jgi:hypothetical protein
MNSGAPGCLMVKFENAVFSRTPGRYTLSRSRFVGTTEVRELGTRRDREVQDPLAEITRFPPVAGGFPRSGWHQRSDTGPGYKR